MKTLQSGRTAALGLVTAILLTGCPEPEPPAPSLDPRIDSVTVAPVVQGDEPVVTVAVTIPGIGNKRVRRITAEFRSTLEPNRPFVAAEGEFDATTGNNWEGTLPALNLGSYEVRVNVNLRTGPGPNGEVAPPIDEIITANATFDVGADDEECFRFDSEAGGLQGWTHGGYTNDATGDAIETCPASMTWVSDTMTVLFGASCVLEPAFEFELVSPDVTGRPGWLRSRGSVVRSGWNLAGISMYPVLELADGSELAKLGADGNPVEQTLPGGTSQLPQFRADLPEPPDSDVVRIRLRASGPAFTQAAEGFFRVAHVCPIPDRPG